MKFEGQPREEEERIRKPQGGSELAVQGYTDTEQGAPRPVLGNESGPYSVVLGRASTDPLATDPGVPAVETGDSQRILTDEYGRIVTVAATPPNNSPTVINLIPQANNAGVLIVSAAPAELFEAYVGDFQTALVRYLLVFNHTTAPPANTVPDLAAIPIDGGWMNYDFTTEAGPTVFTTGIVLALSSTPNKYTAIVAAQNFAITARYKVT